MKRKEIIELAKNNGMTEFVPVGKNDLWVQIEVWVTMAIEEEREACAMVCEESNDMSSSYGLAQAIRARGSNE